MINPFVLWLQTSQKELHFQVGIVDYLCGSHLFWSLVFNHVTATSRYLEYLGSNFEKPLDFLWSFAYSIETTHFSGRICPNPY
jgi:hypothetical protein